MTITADMMREILAAAERRVAKRRAAAARRWERTYRRKSGRTQFDRQGCGAAEAARSEGEARP